MCIIIIIIIIIITIIYLFFVTRMFHEKSHLNLFLSCFCLLCNRAEMYIFY